MRSVRTYLIHIIVKIKTGQLISRITSDLFDITEFAHHCPEEYWIASIKIILGFVLLVRNRCFC